MYNRLLAVFAFCYTAVAFGYPEFYTRLVECNAEDEYKKTDLWIEFSDKELTKPIAIIGWITGPEGSDAHAISRDISSSEQIGENLGYKISSINRDFSLVVLRSSKDSLENGTVVWKDNTRPELQVIRGCLIDPNLVNYPKSYSSK